MAVKAVYEGNVTSSLPVLVNDGILFVFFMLNVYVVVSPTTIGDVGAIGSIDANTLAVSVGMG